MHFYITYIIGRILNMETQEVRFKQWSWSGESLDSSKTLWREYGNRDTYYLKILRIFYIEGPTQYEEIGMHCQPS